MSQFKKELIDDFLGTVRKYMQIRGPMTQRELAEATDTGVSTMSRFLNQQTQELNPNLIANITAKLEIPLYEIIDFVEESYVTDFEHLVKFYKGEEITQTSTMRRRADDFAQQEHEGMHSGGSALRSQANLRVGRSNTKLVYESENDTDDVIKQKIKELSLKQQGFLNEFLNLDSDGRDLVADVGRNIIAYLKQKGIDF
jgi:transcriptional regulator with XRE-family HTH domain